MLRVTSFQYVAAVLALYHCDKNKKILSREKRPTEVRVLGHSRFLPVFSPFPTTVFFARQYLEQVWH